jgi:hypothetical protein
MITLTWPNAAVGKVNTPASTEIAPIEFNQVFITSIRTAEPALPAFRFNLVFVAPRTSPFNTAPGLKYLIETQSCAEGDHGLVAAE